jgi:hypothetical protein
MPCGAFCIGLTSAGRGQTDPWTPFVARTTHVVPVPCTIDAGTIRIEGFADVAHRKTPGVNASIISLSTATMPSLPGPS